MKVTSFTGLSGIDNVKIFKPVSKIFVKCDYNSTSNSDDFLSPTIRVRLVDGKTGSSLDVVPEMDLSMLSEIASKYEGFQRRAGNKFVEEEYSKSGYDLHSVILGQVDANGITAIDLSNDKYLDIELRNCDKRVTYEIWGFEGWNIRPFIRTYSKFYLSQGEFEKKFSVGNNEVLVYPMKDIKEIQFWARGTDASPVYRKEELILDEDGRNDLVYVELDEKNECFFLSNSTYEEVIYSSLPIRFGYSEWGVVDISAFSSFEIRRQDTLGAMTFLMIDTVPTF